MLFTKRFSVDILELLLKRCHWKNLRTNMYNMDNMYNMYNIYNMDNPGGFSRLNLPSCWRTIHCKKVSNKFWKMSLHYCTFSSTTMYSRSLLFIQYLTANVYRKLKNGITHLRQYSLHWGCFFFWKADKRVFAKNIKGGIGWTKEFNKSGNQLQFCLYSSHSQTLQSAVHLFCKLRYAYETSSSITDTWLTSSV